MIRRRIIILAATGFGAGRSPVAPGTVGSLLGIPLYFLLSCIPLLWSAVFLSGFICFSAWISKEAALMVGKEDPPEVVIDEVSGMGVTFFGLPFSFSLAAAGFILFRMFDIWKPCFVRIIDRRISGGVGIVADDVAAGFICRIILGLGCILLGIPGVYY